MTGPGTGGTTWFGPGAADLGALQDPRGEAPLEPMATLLGKTVINLSELVGSLERVFEIVRGPSVAVRDAAKLEAGESLRGLANLAQKASEHAQTLLAELEGHLQ